MSSRPDPFILIDIAPARGHVPSLDGLRAISIALVVLMHFGSVIPGAPPIPGLFGVEIFFAISGFLITRLLLVELTETGRIDFAAFYFRRALRLTPALAAMLAIVAALMLVLGARDLRAPLCSILYISNYCATSIGVMYDGPGVYVEGTWSLAVEEHFYLVFPLLLASLYPRDIRALYGAVAAICVAALGFRLCYAVADRPNFFMIWRSESASDLLMGGCLLSILSAHAAGRAALRRIASTAFLATATGVFLLAEILSGFGKVGIAISQTPIAFWIATLMANVLMNPDLAGVRAFLNRPIMVWLGRISYSLYLWHFLVGMICARFDPTGGWLEYGAIPLSIALASLSYYGIERPILARRDRLARLVGIGMRGRAAARVSLS